MEGLKWWGYLHSNGSIQVKRDFGGFDLDQAVTSPFVERIVRPFVAGSREEALKLVKEKLYA